MSFAAVRGPLLVPRDTGVIDWFQDGSLVFDEHGTLRHAGDAKTFLSLEANQTCSLRASDGVMLPPFLDIHTHVSQYGIRGRFTEGVPGDAPEGRLIAGLNRNVFPEELRCVNEAFARRIVDAFRDDTLAHGVVGGSVFMTSSATASRVALDRLPELWRVGLVLMDQNCPDGLRIDAKQAERDVRGLVERFGSRVIVTDRFAVAASSGLRRHHAKLAGELGLRTQTHLNEQAAEKRFVEQTLYPDFASYTHVYLRDGLLDHRCILAHCIYMTDAEWQIVAETGSVIAHCPTSNLLLGSGVMSLDEVVGRGLPYALATDVGASPTVSMLAEMGRFLRVHHGRSKAATACEALFRATRAPAQSLNLTDHVGCLEPGKPASFIEVRPVSNAIEHGAESAIRSLLPEHLDDPTSNVIRVTLDGRAVHNAG